MLKKYQKFYRDHMSDSDLFNYLTAIKGLTPSQADSYILDEAVNYSHPSDANFEAIATQDVHEPLPSVYRSL